MFFKIYAPKVTIIYESMKDQLIPYLVYCDTGVYLETYRHNGNAELE